MSDRKEILLLVSPICEDSLRAAKELRAWAREKGVEVKEVSALSEEGLRLIERFNIDEVPALIVGERLVAQGRISLEELDVED